MCSWKRYLCLIICLKVLFISETQGCPEGCDCKLTYHINCSGQNLSQVPRGISESTRVLILRNNNISRLKKDDFSRLQHLERLDLSHNKIRKIENRAFEENSKMYSLDLSHNNLRKIGRYTFVGLRDLLLLQLEHNSITTIDRNAFVHSIKRLYVKLIGNRLKCNCALHLLMKLANSTTYNVEGSCTGPQGVVQMLSHIRESDVLCDGRHMSTETTHANMMSSSSLFRPIGTSTNHGQGQGEYSTQLPSAEIVTNDTLSQVQTNQPLTTETVSEGPTLPLMSTREYNDADANTGTTTPAPNQSFKPSRTTQEKQYTPSRSINDTSSIKPKTFTPTETTSETGIISVSFRDGSSHSGSKTTESLSTPRNAYTSNHKSNTPTNVTDQSITTIFIPKLTEAPTSEYNVRTNTLDYETEEYGSRPTEATNFTSDTVIYEDDTATETTISNDVEHQSSEIPDETGTKDVYTDFMTTTEDSAAMTTIGDSAAMTTTGDSAAVTTLSDFATSPMTPYTSIQTTRTKQYITTTALITTSDFNESRVTDAPELPLNSTLQVESSIASASSQRSSVITAETSSTAPAAARTTKSTSSTDVTKTLMPAMRCVNYSSRLGKSYEEEECSTGVSYCKTVVNYPKPATPDQLSLNFSKIVSSCSKECDNTSFSNTCNMYASPPSCSLSSCCAGVNCNKKFIEDLVANGFRYPETTEIETSWVLMVLSNVKKLDVQLQDFLNSLNPGTRHSVLLEYDEPLCAIDHVSGETQCFYYLTLYTVTSSGTELSLSSIQELLESNRVEKPTDLKNLRVFSQNKVCYIQRARISLGESINRDCTYKSDDVVIPYKDFCIIRSDTAVWSGEDTDVCPSRNTEALKKVLDSINNETASEAVRNISTVLGGPDMADTSSVSTADITLVSEVVNKALSLNPPKRADRDTYMKTFSSFQRLNMRNLKSANQKNNSIEKLVRNIDLFAQLVELDDDNTTTLQQSQLLVHVAVQQDLSNGYTYRAKGSQTDQEVEVKLPSLELKQERTKIILYTNNALFLAMNTDSNQSETVSSIIDVSVGRRKLTNLTQPIALTFPHVIQSNETTSCFYWKWEDRTWGDNGMAVSYRGDNYTACTSTHLTNFALLLDVNPYDDSAQLDPVNSLVLSIVSYTGCSISLVGLILTVITYLIHRKLRKDNPSKILINLCVALGLLNLVFVSLTHFRENRIACKFTGVLLHFSLLASFCWMAIEAFYMYIALVLVFSYIKNFIIKVMIIGWGVPAVIVGITLAINVDNYDLFQDQICWLTPHAFYGAFVAPVALIMALNLVAFIMVVKQLRNVTRRRNSTYSEASIEKRQNVSMQVRGAFAVFVLLGLTWTMAIFLAIRETPVFNYLFVTFNSLQGFFLFLFYCVLKRDAQLAWMRTCPCFEYSGGYTSTSSHKLVNGSNSQHTRSKQTLTSTSGQDSSSVSKQNGSVAQQPTTEIFAGKSRSYDLKSCNNNKVPSIPSVDNQNKDYQHSTVHQVDIPNSSYSFQTFNPKAYDFRLNTNSLGLQNLAYKDSGSLDSMLDEKGADNHGRPTSSPFYRLSSMNYSTRV